MNEKPTQRPRYQVKGASEIVECVSGFRPTGQPRIVACSRIQRKLSRIASNKFPQCGDLTAVARLRVEAYLWKILRYVGIPSEVPELLSFRSLLQSITDIRNDLQVLQAGGSVRVAVSVPKEFGSGLFVLQRGALYLFGAVRGGDLYIFHLEHVAVSPWTDIKCAERVARIHKILLKRNAVG